MRHHVFRRRAGENSWTKLAVEDPWEKKAAKSDIRAFAVSGKMAYAATVDGTFPFNRYGYWWKSSSMK